MPDAVDPILPHLNLNLFNANKGITLDGVGYQIRIRAHNSEAHIEVNNPQEQGWGQWEEAVGQLGRYLADQTGNQTLQVFK